MMLSFQMLSWVSFNWLPKLLDERVISDTISEKSSLPFPEPVKMVLQTIALFLILGLVIVGGLLIFSKNPSIETFLFLVVGLACVALVIFVYYNLVWKKVDL
jgi:amino acid permease